MPESQNVWGDSWNKEFNKFLETVMSWKQLGESNTDIINPITGKPRGIDSVFAYNRNPNSPQQVILVEAKSITKLKNTNRSKIQDWIITLLTKLENLSLSQEFKEKYQPELDAKYQLGLLGLWVRNTESYSASILQSWLSQIQVPNRKLPHYIGLISNHTITNLLAIYEEVERLKSTEFCENVEYYVPDYGRLDSVDGRCLPIETLFSKFIFCRAKMLQPLKGKKNFDSYEASITFYLGNIQNYDDLRFVGLAIRNFQLFKMGEVIIYTFRSPTEIRNEIANFIKEFTPVTGDAPIKFEQLIPKNQIPSWMNTR